MRRGGTDRITTSKLEGLQSRRRQSKKILDSLAFFFFVCLVGFLTSSSTTRLYRRRTPRQERLPHMRQSWETMTSVSAGHIIQTPNQPVGSGRLQRELNPGPPHQESRALPTELPRPPPPPPR